MEAPQPAGVADVPDCLAKSVRNPVESDFQRLDDRILGFFLAAFLAAFFEEEFCCAHGVLDQFFGHAELLHPLYHFLSRNRRGCKGLEEARRVQKAGAG